MYGVYTNCTDMCHIYRIVHVCARYINMCDLEINFMFDNQSIIGISNSHYASAALPIWCLQSISTLVHQLTQLASKGRLSSWCHCARDSLC